MPFSSRFIALLLAGLSSCALAQKPPAELARKVSAECATYWAELKDAQAKFAEQASQVKSLGDGPYNTDDDLALLMY